MTLSPGELVVCVDAAPCRYGEKDDDMSGLVEGKVYTVRNIEIGFWDWRGGDFTGVYLEEIPAFEWEPTNWPAYAIERFRPVSRKSSELFQSLLEPSLKVLARRVFDRVSSPHETN